jgi:hypothetical protein
MFSKPTVLIIGAGASAEFGMPVGSDLKSRVAEAVTSRFDVELAPRLPTDELDEAREAGVTLARIIPHYKSMDEALHFLSSQSNVVQLGKAAIANEIAKAERNSNLFGAMHGGTTGNAAKTAAFATWANSFLEIAISGARQEDIPELFKNVSVIDFNYDRVFEQFLQFALCELGTSGEIATKSVEALRPRIHRPYGLIGPLDWQHAQGLAFGSNVEDLASVSNQIKTYTEGGSDEHAEKIKAVIEGAEIVFVLGFGCHEQNVRILSIEDRPTKVRKIFMTLSGFHGQVTGVIAELMRTKLASTEPLTRDTVLARTFLIRYRPSIDVALAS